MDGSRKTAGLDGAVYRGLGNGSISATDEATNFVNGDQVIIERHLLLPSVFS
jgi:hypothetical protein